VGGFVAAFLRFEVPLRRPHRVCACLLCARPARPGCVGWGYGGGGGGAFARSCGSGSAGATASRPMRGPGRGRPRRSASAPASAPAAAPYYAREALRVQMATAPNGPGRRRGLRLLPHRVTALHTHLELPHPPQAHPPCPTGSSTGAWCSARSSRSALTWSSRPARVRERHAGVLATVEALRRLQPLTPTPYPAPHPPLHPARCAALLQKKANTLALFNGLTGADLDATRAVYRDVFQSTTYIIPYPQRPW
jgi:hypothetical protein